VTKRKYYIDERCTKIGGSKIVKNPMKKKVGYNILKDQNSKIK
jgi:hypothetical protein